MYFIVAVAVLCTLFIPGFSMAEEAADTSFVLHLQGRHFDPVAESAASGDGASESALSVKTAPMARRLAVPAAASGGGYYIIQFTGPVQAAWKADLEARGVVLFDYIPQHAFIAKVDESQVPTIQALDTVRWVGAYEPEYRLSGTVYDVTPGELEASGGTVALQVLAFPGENASDLSVAVRDLGGTVGDISESKWGIKLRVDMPVTAIDGLKGISGVKWVESAPDHRTNNNVATSIVRARGVRGKTWSAGGKLYGEGQIVAICDSGLDTGVIGTIHEDFDNGAGGSRVLANVVLSGASQQDTSGHGTHVAGIVAGNGKASGADPATDDYPDTSYAGIAPKASLYVQSAGSSSGDSSLPGIPSDLTNLFQPAYDAGARIHSNSWGNTGVGDYDSESLTVDQFAWTNKDFLVLYAGGNNGNDLDYNGVIDQYSQDTPGTAKNCLTVGASESLRSSGGFSTRAYSTLRTSFATDPIGSDLPSDRPDGMAAFSNRGPTVDGRYKPEIVAPGTDIISTRSSAQVGNGWGAYNDKYYYSGGTSMATPVVAGAAALMREYLIDEEGIASPSAALVKTSLIHGATSITPGQYGDGDTKEVGDAPDPAQGWGRLNLEGAMNISSERVVDFNDVTASPVTDTSYSRTFTYSVADSGEPFRATLGWTDYPGSTVASGGLVNDLDLRVQKPDGSWAYPDNARNLSSFERVDYLDGASVSGFYTGEKIGVRVTAPSYPKHLESVVLAMRNSSRIKAAVTLAVYSWTGSTVGTELFRKEYAFFPSGEFLVPVGIDVTGDVVVVVEKTNTDLGVYCKIGNSTGRALVNTGSGWSSTSVTPAIICGFRSQVAATDFDRINNTVSVTIPEPETGTYQVEVAAHTVPNGPQPYALVVSRLASAISTSGANSIGQDPTQPDAPTVAILSRARTSTPVSTVNSSYGAGLEEVYGDVVSFSGNITANYGQGLVSMRYAVTGLPARAAGTLVLKKLLGGGRSRDFNYPQLADYANGNWWLTTTDGGFVAPEQILDPAAKYYVVSVVQDNGLYDTNTVVNVVDDPQVLGVSVGGGGSSGGGGGGGGCTTLPGGGTDASLPLMLLVAALALVVRRGSTGWGRDKRLP